MWFRDRGKFGTSFALCDKAGTIYFSPLFKSLPAAQGCDKLASPNGGAHVKESVTVFCQVDIHSMMFTFSAVPKPPAQSRNKFLGLNFKYL